MHNGQPVLRESILLKQGNGKGFMLGHELNNYLTPLVGMAQLMAVTAVESSNTRLIELSRDVYESARTVARFAEKLRQIRTLEFGHQSLNHHRADITVLIDNVIKTLRPDETTDLENLDFVYDCDSCEVEFDFDLLPRALDALVRNAIEHVHSTGEEGDRWVRIELNADTESVHIGIRNGGTPIPPDQLDSFFDPFNADRQHKRNAAGLGTTYAKLVVEAHGGHIEVTSTGEEGTHVRFSIPRS